MKLKRELRLTPSERQALTRIAKGRLGRRRPAVWEVDRARALLKGDEGPEGEGWTDEAIAAALDVSAQTVGRWRRQAVAEGPEAVLERQARAPRPCKLDGAGEERLLQLAQSTPAGSVGPCVYSPASWQRARTCPPISYETVRRILKKSKITI